MSVRPFASDKRYLTLITDASFCPTEGFGTWAAWWKIDGVMNRRSGVIATPTLSSTEAELFAMVNGLHLAVKTLAELGGDAYLVAQTDCQAVIDWLLKPVGALPIDARARAIQLGRKLVKDEFTGVRWKHVKGHTASSAPRSVVQDWCDREAKRLLIAERERRVTKRNKHD